MLKFQEFQCEHKKKNILFFLAHSTIKMHLGKITWVTFIIGSFSSVGRTTNTMKKKKRNRLRNDKQLVTRYGNAPSTLNWINDVSYHCRRHGKIITIVQVNFPSMCVCVCFFCLVHSIVVNLHSFNCNIQQKRYFKCIISPSTMLTFISLFCSLTWKYLLHESILVPNGFW